MTARDRDGSDLLIVGALLVDGLRTAPRRADVLVRDGRIAAVGPDASAPGARRIDADGLVLAPGFVDMHAHSDLAVLADGPHLAKTLQGVTCEVVGQDGLSYAPVTGAARPVIREQIAGWNGTPDGIDLGWDAVGGYLDEIDRRGSGTNVCYLVPQGTVRMDVVGLEDRPATAAEVARMQELVAHGMRDGAFGLSAGLTYVPGMFADTDEIVALCRVVAAHGGYFSPHHRSYGGGALAAYREMIDVAERSGCPVHLTHATMNFPVNRGRAGDLLDLVDEALDRGIDLTLDSYPYLAGATTLSAILPSRAQTGGVDATLARLRDPRERAEIARVLEVDGSDGCHGVPVDWSTIEISGVRDPALRAVVGRTIAELAAAERRAPADVCFDLLRADRLGVSILQHVGDEANLRTIMRHPRHLAGSDGILVGGKPHPRGAGTFARYLGTYVREEQVLTLPEAIEHLSAAPARRLGLADRGRLDQGAVADLVLFDPETVSDGATYDAPRQPPRGIPHVLVGGTAVVEHGERTDARPGRALRHRPVDAHG